ncbi:dtdp-4-dehydrorhamnose dehydrogenase, putative [Ricinus communis]|uniref:Dtdp-4-dehydrorhamnose dehydrogenase, putative n=1 Tax=Ricinus communis TaxID=3988 RepID=B9TK86_RICCO|nr:dtdp-4-dehydrorhamnose dehydrogenase, putative [Ricinus communis]
MVRFASEIVTQYRALESVRGWPPLAVNEVQPIAAAEYPTPAKRPANSRLSTAKLEQTFGVTLREWSIALNQVMAELAMTAAG